MSGKLKYPGIILEKPTTWGHLKNPAAPIDFYEEPFVALRKIIQTKNKPIKLLADNLIIKFRKKLNHYKLPVDDDAVSRVLKNSLIRFENNRLLYLWLFRRSQTKGLVVIDSDAVIAQIAAAKELELPVFEFQHGAIGSNDVGYQWHQNLKKYKSAMAIPDYLLSYGKFWKDLLVNNNFWLEDEVISTGSSKMDRFRKKIEKHRNQAEQIQILFTSQWTTRDSSIKFWNRFLKSAHSRGLKVYLIIKVHPSEKNSIGQYKALETQHAGLCEVIFDEEDTFTLMLRSDVHVSYYSTSLIESYSLGIPSVSICSGHFKDGFAGSFGLCNLKDIIIHVNSTEEFLQYLRNSKIQKTKNRTSEYFFQKGFIEKATQAINSVI